MATVADFIAEVRGEIGVPYLFGGDTPAGFDCSGLMFWAAQRCGVDITRTSQTQFATLTPVTDPQPGDLVFFDIPEDGPPQPQHVGMVTGPNQMIDAPHTGVEVRYDAINGFATIMGYRRITALSPAPNPPPPAPSPPPSSSTTEASMLSLPPTGGLLAAGLDGGVFALEGAGYYGSLPGLGVVPAKPIVGIAASPTGRGYWLCGLDGGVFAFGDASYHGNLVAQVAKTLIPCIGIEPWQGAYVMVTHLTGGVPAVFPFSPAVSLSQEEADAVSIVTKVDPHDNLVHTVAFHSSTGDANGTTD